MHEMISLGPADTHLYRGLEYQVQLLLAALMVGQELHF